MECVKRQVKFCELAWKEKKMAVVCNIRIELDSAVVDFDYNKNKKYAVDFVNE